MENKNHADSVEVHREGQTLRCKGRWVTENVAILSSRVATFSFLPHETVVIDVGFVSEFDTAGLWLLSQIIASAKASNALAKLQGLSDKQAEILNKIEAYHLSTIKASPPSHMNVIEHLGLETVNLGHLALNFIDFIGEITTCFIGWLVNTSKIRWQSISNNIDAIGLKASGIIALLSFLIGLVLAYQVGVQLQNYGASIYVVDLLGISLLREFSPLLTAIIVAGRSGSAFAAQIGTMKLNEEIDALRTLGLSPTEILVLPKVVGLLIALPLLTILASCFSVFGGMIMSKIMLGISYTDFIHRFGRVIHLKTLMLGEIKTPIFAVLIAAIGCFQGLLVTNSAASVGERTTISVVHSIFMIIVADAFFSVIYSALGL